MEIADRVATPKLQGHHQMVMHLRNYLNNRIIGQTALIDRTLIALLCGGHLLVEGAPGLAKTSAIKELATGINASFHRIQFTPDLLPGDLTGTEIFRPKAGQFEFQAGPLFNNLVLADEINRASAKVQSALLEAMEEKQITIGRETYALPDLFMVMATQNPIEQEGTFPLPEAQLDRFLLYVKVDYPSADVERQILILNRELAAHAGNTPHKPPFKMAPEIIFAIRQQLFILHMSPMVEEYLVQLVLATRQPQAYDASLAGCIRFGASPRATIGLDKAARAHAWLAGRDFVSPADIHAVLPDMLRHRILLSYEAEAEGMSSDEVIQRLIQIVPVP